MAIFYLPISKSRNLGHHQLLYQHIYFTPTSSSSFDDLWMPMAILYIPVVYHWFSGCLWPFYIFLWFIIGSLDAFGLFSSDGQNLHSGLLGFFLSNLSLLPTTSLSYQFFPHPLLPQTFFRISWRKG